MQRVQNTLAESKSTADTIAKRNYVMLQEKIKAMSSRLEEEIKGRALPPPVARQPLPEEVEFNYPSKKYESRYCETATRNQTVDPMMDKNALSPP